VVDPVGVEPLKRQRLRFGSHLQLQPVEHAVRC
jgi:hypothetical protein